MNFDDLFRMWAWLPIRGCPGRFKLKHPQPLSPAALLGPQHPLDEYRTIHARDPIIVAKITGGGLISYRRSDGTYVHTLNTPEGFQRKLEQLEIR